MKKKEMMTLSDLVDLMKAKGITFHILSESDALRCMKDEVYYTKLNAYRKNYDKYEEGPKQGQYKDLEYAYLKELYEIDRELRRIILLLSLEIEHAIKIHLLRNIYKNPMEDGYQFVRRYLADDRVASGFLRRKLDYCYCREHLEHHRDNLPIWVLFEVFPLGELRHLYAAYYEMYPKEKPTVHSDILEYVVNLRNAAAHNNCLIYDVRQPGKNAGPLMHLLRKKGLLDREMIHQMQFQFSQDFVGFFIVYNSFVQVESHKREAIRLMKDFIYKRCKVHKSYFEKNNILCSQYQFITSFLETYFFN